MVGGSSISVIPITSSSSGSPEPHIQEPATSQSDKTKTRKENANVHARVNVKETDVMPHVTYSSIRLLSLFFLSMRVCLPGPGCQKDSSFPSPCLILAATPFLCWIGRRRGDDDMSEMMGTDRRKTGVRQRRSAGACEIARRLRDGRELKTKVNHEVEVERLNHPSCLPSLSTRVCQESSILDQ